MDPQIQFIPESPVDSRANQHSTLRKVLHGLRLEAQADRFCSGSAQRAPGAPEIRAELNPF